MRILVVEDNPRLGPSLKRGLAGVGYAADLIADGGEALAAARVVDYDLIVLDLRLPGMSGLKVCHELRAAKRGMPILILTALGDVDSRVTGLDLGADDYLTKPFVFRELEARIRALLRRETAGGKTAELSFLDIRLDTRTRQVWRGQRQIEFTSKQYALLEFLMRHPRQVLSRIARATADPSVNVRRHAVLALASCGADGRATTTLDALIARESDLALLRHARWALRQRERRGEGNQTSAG